MRRILIILCSAALLSGCKNNQPAEKNLDINDMISSSGQNSDLAISEESMDEIIQSFPSPVEIATLIKASGTHFNEGLLNSKENLHLYHTDNEKAYAMGIYAGDLGYINIYDKSYMALNYLGTIKDLANDLQVGQFFDFETIKRFASNSDKLDSLLYLTTLNFARMDHYLREQKRSKLSVLIVTGTWMEGLYLATQVVKTHMDADLKERIAEQKMILDQVMLLLSVYENDPYFADLNYALSPLKDVYDNVAIEYTYREPETKEVDGRLVVVDNSTTEVKINDEQVAEICRLVEEIRNKTVTES